MEEVNESEQLIDDLIHEIEEERENRNAEKRTYGRKKVLINAGEEIISNDLNRRREIEINDGTDGPHESIVRNENINQNNHSSGCTPENTFYNTDLKMN